MLLITNELKAKNKREIKPRTVNAHSTLLQRIFRNANAVEKTNVQCKENKTMVGD